MASLIKNSQEFGEPYQSYCDVCYLGKNVQGSKKRIKWIIGFTKGKDVHITLVHSLFSGKKVRNLFK